MAVNPRTHKDAALVCRLEPFRPAWAELIVSWVRDEQEAYWLAPRTPPPLTADEILRWQRPGREGFMSLEGDGPEPRGYGELNLLSSGRRRYWLGHLIVDPAQRGRGCGVQLTRLLLRHAAVRQGAREVTLVVFPENRRAVSCYLAAGLREDGYETHEFPAYGRRVRLLRMTAGGKLL